MWRFLRICSDVSGLGYGLFACVLLADLIIGLPYPCVNREVSPVSNGLAGSLMGLCTWWVCG